MRGRPHSLQPSFQGPASQGASLVSLPSDRRRGRGPRRRRGPASGPLSVGGRSNVGWSGAAAEAPTDTQTECPVSERRVWVSVPRRHVPVCGRRGRGPSAKAGRQEAAGRGRRGAWDRGRLRPRTPERVGRAARGVYSAPTLRRPGDRRVRHLTPPARLRRPLDLPLFDPEQARVYVVNKKG